MSNSTEVRHKQLDQMSMEHISTRIWQNQREANMLLEQLLTRAHMQEYTEQQHGELLVLLQEALNFIEEVPVDERCILEWAGQRSTLIGKIRK